MSKKNRGDFTEHYWQSAQLNRDAYMLYRTQIMSLAMTRFKWILPEECDPRFLEWTLLTEGRATIASPVKKNSEGELLGSQVFYSLKIAGIGEPNMYDNPTKWRAIGANGQTNFTVTPFNGVIIWDNTQRISELRMVNYYAMLLAQTDKVFRVNLNQQMTPWLITGDASMKFDMENAYKQITGGEPAIIATKQFSDMMKIEAINTQTPFLAEEVHMAKKNIWDQIYSYLGITALSEKSERMLLPEITLQNRPSTLMALSCFDARRTACKELKNRFGIDAQCVWNEDYQSDNFNFAMNAREQAEAKKGATS